MIWGVLGHLLSPLGLAYVHPLGVIFQSIFMVEVRLFAFPLPLHIVAVDSQKFGDFYGSDRTVFSEYSGSWIL